MPRRLTVVKTTLKPILGYWTLEKKQMKQCLHLVRLGQFYMLWVVLFLKFKYIYPKVQDTNCKLKKKANLLWSSTFSHSSNTHSERKLFWSCRGSHREHMASRLVCVCACVWGGYHHSGEHLSGPHTFKRLRVLAEVKGELVSFILFWGPIFSIILIITFLDKDQS